ncbi:hypothetical protein [uncultured Marinobacter sp.]|uniref:hypothetical protein n=1 Tax=uncultured Marinobacter sp. TaxID=187379 RepID=UPI0030D93E7D
MAKQKRKAKHSVRSRDQRLFSTSRLWTWESERSETGAAFTTAQTRTMFGWVDLQYDLARHLIALPRNWLVCVRALCISSDGVMWMEQADFTLTSQTIANVEGAYHELRREVLSQQRTDQVFDCGWICRTWKGQNPEDVDQKWFYHDTPKGIAPNVKSEGAPYSPERQAIWQEVNREYLAELEAA